MGWCHIIINCDVPEKTLADLTNNLEKIRFKVTKSRNATDFEIAKNLGNDKASTEEFGIFLLLIYALGCEEPNKFFTSQIDSKNTIDFVQDILKKIGKSELLEKVPKLIFVESFGQKVNNGNDFSK